MSNLIVYTKGGIVPPPDDSTVNLMAGMSGLSIHTQRAYRSWICRFLNAFDGSTVDPLAAQPSVILPALVPAALKSYLGVLKMDGLGAQSLMQARASILWLAGYMADLGLVPYETPAAMARVKQPKAESGQRRGRWLNIEEIKRLLQWGYIGNKAIDRRNAAIVAIAVTLGLRRDEIATLKWSDMVYEGPYRVLVVHGKGEKIRLAKLPDVTLGYIQKWRDLYGEGDGPMFCKIQNQQPNRSKLEPHAIWDIVKKAAKLAKIQDISPHDLRRSFARGAFEAGVSYEQIQQALGHASVQTTERYVNATLKLDRTASDVFADLLKGK